jgi:SAM-dependent methyltransferase
MANGSQEYYRGEAGQRYQQQKRAVPEAAVPWVAKLRGEKFQPFIKSTDTVVEFGVGLGWNLANLQCARRIGTDLENFLPPALKTAIEFVPTTTEIPNDSVDVVICHHVLEHVESPAEMLREARRILKMNGQLLAYVPFETESRYRRYDAAEPNHHLYSWNVQTLGNLVDNRGFALQKCESGEFGYDRFAAKLALRFSLGENGFRMFRRLAHLVRPGREVRVVAKKINA